MEKTEDIFDQSKRYNPSEREVFPSIFLVGCGKMGVALRHGFRHSFVHGFGQGGEEEKHFSCVVVDRHLPSLPDSCCCVASISDIPQNFIPHVIILAIKPQKAEEVLIALGARYANQKLTLLSVMAGRTVAYLEKMWCVHSCYSPIIVRAMPNTPSVVRAGVCGLYASGQVGAKQKQQCERLMRAVGQVVWVEDEKLIDVVTAISGSGPAYVFLLAEWLEKAGIEQGLPQKVARLLAREVIYGAGKMLHEQSTDASELRQNVTSPGGTTAAALSVLMREEAFPKIILEAVTAAVRRAGELA
ncbi:MAG: pyrroline-5-carboxylate reductase, partial [Acetobacter sp.]|nr:pyrroline-5-carboxylate reductase [Acetobacter sp.]